MMFGKMNLTDFCNKRQFIDNARIAFANWLGGYALTKQWEWQWDLWLDAYNNTQSEKLIS